MDENLSTVHFLVFGFVFGFVFVFVFGSSNILFLVRLKFALGVEIEQNVELGLGAWRSLEERPFILLVWDWLWLEPQAPRVLGVKGGKPHRLANKARHSSSVAVLLLLEDISLHELCTCNGNTLAVTPL